MKIINPEIEKYVEQHTSSERAILKKINRETHAKVLRPRMLSGHLQGKLLEMISHMIQPQRILEIGTFTGYSAVCLSSGLKPGGKIYTIDKNAELEDFTRQFFSEAGLTDVIEYFIGDALEILPTINEVFDIVFIDADKDNYTRYYELVFEMLRPGGFIIADNVLWDGKVLSDAGTDDIETQSIIKFNKFVHMDPRVENLILPFRDGVSLIRKIM